MTPVSIVTLAFFASPRRREIAVKRSIALPAALPVLGLFVAIAFASGPVNAAGTDDQRGLQRGADSNSVTISGVSSGAAMAMQYAVANSASVVGVATIAGPGWGCARGRFSTAVDACMCGRQPVDSGFTDAVKLAYGSGEFFDPMDSETGRPQALSRGYVFQSPADATVVKQSGEAAVAFLRNFTGRAPTKDFGNKSDGSKSAGHGILSPDGTDACAANGKEKTYIRRCGKHDNAGRLFKALYGDLAPTRGIKKAPRAPYDVWEFDQQTLIDGIKADPFRNPLVTPDVLYPVLSRSEERKNFDLAGTGFLYVPTGCRGAGHKCRVHLALHGCKQDPRTFAAQAGYNYWAEQYDVIVVYPAIKAHKPAALDEGEVCKASKNWSSTVWLAGDASWVEANYNGCWDWWGFLDTGDRNLEGTPTRYLTKKGPQMMFLKKIVEAVTAPVP